MQTKTALTFPPKPLQPSPSMPTRQLMTQGRGAVPGTVQQQTAATPVPMQQGRGRPAGPAGTGAPVMNAQGQPAQTGVVQPSAVAGLTSSTNSGGFGNTPATGSSGSKGSSTKSAHKKGRPLMNNFASVLGKMAATKKAIDPAMLAQQPAMAPGLGAAGSVAGTVGLGAMGATLGAGAGGLMGAGRGNTAEGVGRGVIRGGTTGLGIGAGGHLGSMLGGMAGHESLGSILGSVAGGVGGWNLAGHAMGTPMAGKHETDMAKSDKKKEDNQ